MKQSKRARECHRCIRASQARPLVNSGKYTHFLKFATHSSVCVDTPADAGAMMTIACSSNFFFGHFAQVRASSRKFAQVRASSRCWAPSPFAAALSSSPPPTPAPGGLPDEVQHPEQDGTFSKEEADERVRIGSECTAAKAAYQASLQRIGAELATLAADDGRAGLQWASCRQKCKMVTGVRCKSVRHRACSYGARRRMVEGLVALLLLLSGASSSAPHTCGGHDGGLLRPLNGGDTRGRAFVVQRNSAVVAGREADAAVRTRARVNNVWMDLSGDAQRSGPLEPKGFARGGTNSA